MINSATEPAATNPDRLDKIGHQESELEDQFIQEFNAQYLHLVDRYRIPVNPQSMVQSCRNTSQMLHDNIHALSTWSENEFLTIGERLNGLQQHTSRLSGLSLEVLDIISGNATDKIFNSITDILDRMDISLEKMNLQIRKDLGYLNDIINHFDSIFGFESEFEKIVKTLQAYSRATRIESTRLQEMGTDFNDLGKRIENFSNLIQDKFTRFFRKISQLKNTFKNTILKINRVQIEQLKETRENINNTLSSLIVLTNRQTSSYVIAEMVTKMSNKVSTSFIEIIMSLQSHDAVRQRLEHVGEALSWGIVRLDERDFSTFQNEDESSFKIDFLRRMLEYKALTDLSYKQLNEAGITFYQSVSTVLENIGNVGTNISLLNGKVKDLIGNSRMVKAAYLNDIEDGVKLLINMLKENTKNRQNLTDLIVTASEEVSSFTNFINEIEAIGSEIEMIALNARIKAAKAGIEGAAMAVVAQHIKQVSVSTQGNTESLLHSLKKITDTAKTLYDNVDNGKRLSGQIGSTEILDELEESLVELREINQQVIEKTNEINAFNQDINKTVKDITVNTNFHDQFREQAQQILSQIQNMANELAPYSFNLPNSAVKIPLRVLAQQYSMDQERDIHAEILDDFEYFENAKQDDDIFFDDDMGDNEFGDNVELF